MRHSKLLPRYRLLTIIQRDRQRVPLRTSYRLKQVVAFDKFKTPFITAVTANLICAFVFAYADCWFSHAVAHIIFKKSKFNVTKPEGPRPLGPRRNRWAAYASRQNRPSDYWFTAHG